MQTEQKPKSKSQQIKLIASAWASLCDCLNNQTMRPHGNLYLQEHIKEEKGHRRISGNNGLTVPQAAKLFAVRDIAKAMLGEKAPDIADYLICRQSIFYSHSLVANYRDAITKALAGFDLTELAEMDYVELNKIEN